MIDIFKLNTPKYFDPKEVKDLEEYLEQYAETHFVVEHENKIIGGSGYHINEAERSGQIRWIFFHPGFARKGLGKQVAEHCLAILRSDIRVEKLVITTSQMAYRFFGKLGYQLLYIEKDYWGKGLDLYMMEQKIERENSNS